MSKQHQRSFPFSCATIAIGMVVLGGCAAQNPNTPSVVPAHPFWDGVTPVSGRSAEDLPPPIMLAGEGSWARGSTKPTVVDTRMFQPQVIERGPWKGKVKRPAEILPPHSRDKTLHKGTPNDLDAGGMTNRPRIDTENSAFFPGIEQSPWAPPDPSIAVGPNHVLETVNMEVAWFDKEGNKLFQQRLDSTGDPGFFEELDAGSFTFDPKCFYDTIRNRYIVLALEKYQGEAWITFAVSDDDDPEGIWFKYRTYALVEIDGTTYWVDYPGFGFDDTGWYVSGNLFRDSGDGSGFAGALIRSIDPAGALVGEEVEYVDFLPGGASVQVAQVVDGDSSVIFTRVRDSTSLRFVHVVDPLGEPSMFTSTVDVPEFTSPNDPPPTPGGSPLNPIDSRILSVMVRNGHLWTGHSISTPEDATTVGRWYEFDLDSWPEDSTGEPFLIQAGEIRPGAGIHTCFPAIAVNGNGNAAIVYTRSSELEVPSLHVAGRVPSDPLGTLGESTELAVSTDVPDWSGSYRWGDYFDAAMDPIDDNVYWVVGEIYTPSGWLTEIASFTVDLVGDLNGDGMVNGADLTILLSAWGTGSAVADLNHDGVVNGADLTILLSNWS